MRYRFDRKKDSSTDCFTGQPPGIGHDGGHVYTAATECAWEMARSPQEGGGVEVNDSGVGGQFPANSGCCWLAGASSTA